MEVIAVKKFLLIAMTLVPFAAGHLMDVMLLVPVAGTLTFYLVPLAVLWFLFWLGRQYAGTDWGPGRALLFGNAAGLLSLALYLWQFEGQNAEERSLLLAGLSQKYFTAAPQYLLGPVARLFPRPVTALEAFSFLLLAGVFALGFFTGRKAKKGKS